MSTLYLVATPIGNLEDMSARGIRILKEVKLIACEDTRHSGKLLAHFEIRTPMTSYFEHNKGQKLEKVLSALFEGDVALISDAGTPGLNDPGYLLVRAALAAGHIVSPIPGPSAPIAALVTSGLPSDQFLYLGYLPRKQNDRLRALEEIKQQPYTLIYLESPHRMDDALADLYTVLGEREIAVAGELTKLYEEIYRGKISAAQTYFEKHPARGEYTLVIAGADETAIEWTEDKITQILKAELDGGASPSRAAKEVAKLAGWPKSKVYDLLLRVQESE